MRIFELRIETWGVSNSARVYLTKDAQGMHNDAASVHPGGNSILQLLGLLFIFVLVLIAAWYVSKFIGNKTMQGFGNKNINIIETFNMGNNKAIQIIRVADKYLAIGIGKEEINVLTELKEEHIVLESGDKSNMSFKDILNNAKGVLSKSKLNIKGSKDEENSR